MSVGAVCVWENQGECEGECEGENEGDFDGGCEGGVRVSFEGSLARPGVRLTIKAVV